MDSSNRIKIVDYFIVFAVCICISLLSACNSNGNSEKAKATQPTEETGEGIYKKTCLVCHQANGQGVPVAFPPLAKSDFLADKAATIRQVIKGSNGPIKVNGKDFSGVMPPQPLNDAEVAKVLNYIYSNWENPGITVTEDDVKAERKK